VTKPEDAFTKATAKTALKAGAVSAEFPSRAARSSGAGLCWSACLATRMAFESQQWRS